MGLFPLCLILVLSFRLSLSYVSLLALNVSIYSLTWFQVVQIRAWVHEHAPLPRLSSYHGGHLFGMPDLRDYRNDPGLYVPRPPKIRGFIYSRALATAGSATSADAYIFREAAVPLSCDYKGPCFPRSLNQRVANEFQEVQKRDFDAMTNGLPILSPSPAPSVVCQNAITSSCSQKKDPTLNSLQFTKSHDTSAYREYLRLLRFRNVRAVIRLVRYFLRVLKTPV